MTTKIEWPIGEPLETDAYRVTATVLFVSEGGYMSGYVEDKEGNKFARKWNPEGVSCDRGNLIPPKREPRTATIWVKWDTAEVWNKGVLAPLNCTEHTIIHPEDREPITREGIEIAYGKSLLARERIDAIMAYLKERGYE